MAYEDPVVQEECRILLKKTVKTLTHANAQNSHGNISRNRFIQPFFTYFIIPIDSLLVSGRYGILAFLSPQKERLGLFQNPAKIP